MDCNRSRVRRAQNPPRGLGLPLGGGWFR